MCIRDRQSTWGKVIVFCLFLLAACSLQLTPGQSFIVGLHKGVGLKANMTTINSFTGSALRLEVFPSILEGIASDNSDKRTFNLGYLYTGFYNFSKASFHTVQKDQNLSETLLTAQYLLNQAQDFQKNAEAYNKATGVDVYKEYKEVATLLKNGRSYYAGLKFGLISKSLKDFARNGQKGITTKPKERDSNEKITKKQQSPPAQ
eukprot:TRINITY_DN5914_c0_g1_i3.p1 TRINITY_DN5914_c0_g1~~TRINITY_DN5914_c0_g1_i3.p1  ORF type:complete len:223 (+),score=50.75 TRINITY_DN5914_c0_g1_i3:60-671(+)